TLNRAGQFESFTWNFPASAVRGLPAANARRYLNLTGDQPPKSSACVPVEDLTAARSLPDREIFL
ncbi:MAG TPA: hypothetical protein VL866_19965, partial [Pyrinomonadaceae bacterium]|nr:hypothetical protein [Pyrinomonadaceae bacterium]